MFLKIFNSFGKETWKIQLGEENTINIKKKLDPIGKLFDFSYSDKTAFHVSLIEKKVKTN